ncbi:MAG TPA: hypothetical protein VG713_16280, partial [Pirellulales bacterium]|nr:hypothetical protein [Pirellulales bacterium]
MRQLLEAVTVCVDYSDFLAETLPHTLTLVDRMLVVTSYEDVETQELCAHMGVECRPTDLMYHGGEFAKARAIDFGLAFLRSTGWCLHLDADIWLPPMTRQILNDLPLDPECIYGCDRMMCNSWGAWRRFITAPQHKGSTRQHTRNCFVLPPPWPMGARLAIPEYGGYIPIGFFQLWHSQTKRRYPLHHSTAERTDVQFSLQWPRGKRRLIPEIVAVHLESETSGFMGDNWGGRKTPQFGPHDPFGRRRRKHR